jgi:putative phosphoesterase
MDSEGACMMKILVFSDSHGAIQPMLDAIQDHKPDLVLHLGDYTSDCTAVLRTFPEIALKSVRGNCDVFAKEPETALFTVEDIRLFITHGHRYRVKTTPDAALNAAHFSEARVLAFGHTHRPLLMEKDGLLVVNPGSAAEKKYAVLEVEHGRVTGQLCSLN